MSMTVLVLGPFRDIVSLSDPAPLNSDWIEGSCVSTHFRVGTFRDIVRLSDPAPLNSD